MSNFDTEESASWIPPGEAVDIPDTEDGSTEAFVRVVVAAHVEAPVRTIALSQRLFADLGITPLGLVLLCLDIEDVKRVVLPFEELTQVVTVADLVHFIALKGSKPRP